MLRLCLSEPEIAKQATDNLLKYLTTQQKEVAARPANRLERITKTKDSKPFSDFYYTHIASADADNAQKKCRISTKIFYTTNQKDIKRGLTLWP